MALTVERSASLSPLREYLSSVTEWSENNAAISELVDKAVRKLFWGTREVDSIVGGILFPAFTTITCSNRDISVPGQFQSLCRLIREFLVVLDAVDVLSASDLRSDSGVVPTAGPDFENGIARRQIEQLGHDGDHVWSADSLSISDW